MTKRLWLFVLLPLVVVMISCIANPPQTLPFETIAQQEDMSNADRTYAYYEPKPALLVIAQPEEVISPGLNISFDRVTRDRLKGLDFAQSFAVLVFHGVAPTGGYSVTIQEITRQGNEVIIKANFAEPEGDRIVTLGVTSPYHLVSVAKEGEWGEDIHFMLEKEGRGVSKLTHFIP